MKKKKAAFIIPPLLGGRYFLQPPLGSLWTISLLSDSITAELHDLRVNESVCFHDYDYLVVCTSELDIIQNYPIDYRLLYAISFCKHLKKTCHGKLIIVGAHSSLYPERMLNATGADYVVVGEWETAVATLLNSDCSNKSYIQVVIFFKHVPSPNTSC